VSNLKLMARITVAHGDGIGPEIMDATLRLGILYGGALAALSLAFTCTKTAEANFASAVAVCFILGCLRLIGRSSTLDSDLKDSE
jgi:uncharacterized protein YaaW (UPF0174 family)